MQSKTRAAWVMILSLVALLSFSCKNPQKNSNQGNNSGTPPKLGRWIAQFRSPYSQGYEGNELSENFFYSSIAVASPSIVYVAGDMLNPKTKEDRVGVVVKTTDGGQTWAETILEQPNVQVEALNAIHFINAEEGWIVGADSVHLGIMFKTVDGGRTWAFSRISTRQAPTCLYFADQQTGWMGGGTPYPGEDEGSGGPSDILGTTDGGHTWQSQIKLPVSIYDIQFLDKSLGWACGSKGTIYHTSDGGRTWNPQRSEIELGDGPQVMNTEGSKLFRVYGIHFTDPEHGYAAAGAEEEAAGRVLGTSNGGEAWAKQRIVGDAGARDVLFLNPSEGFILADRGKYIYHTIDGNRTWLTEPKVFEQDVLQVRLGAADAAHVWAVGGGAIFFRVNE